MTSELYNRVHNSIIAERIAEARAVAPGKVQDVSQSDAGERIVTFLPGIGELRGGTAVADGPVSGAPVLYPGGGGWSIVWPLLAGDEGLGLAADRNPELWDAAREVGAAPVRPQPHDLSNLRVLPVTQTAPSGPSDPGDDLVISNERGEVLRLGLGTWTLSTPGPDPTVIATFEATAAGDVKISVQAGKVVELGDDLAEELTKVAKLGDVLALAVADALAAAPPPPTIDNGVAAFTAFLARIASALVPTAGTTKVKGT